jgi:hypothetical protein
VNADSRSLPLRASQNNFGLYVMPPPPSRARRFPPKAKDKAQPNTPTCRSNTAHVSGPYFSFHSA